MGISPLLQPAVTKSTASPTSNEYMDQIGKNKELTTMVSYCPHNRICFWRGDFTYTLYYLHFVIFLITVHTAVPSMLKFLTLKGENRLRAFKNRMLQKRSGVAIRWG